MQEGDKRIAKNTIIVYIRLGITIIVGLLTSRFVLQALGESDFGLYNVVGGVLALFTCISASMTTTTTRFINYEMGKPDGDVNRIFNICVIIHLVASVIILILAETIGLYYIHHYLNVAPGKEADAEFVFHISTIVACVGIINIPYQGLIIAKENFSFIAIIEIVNSLLKLLLVLLLFTFDNYILRIYAAMMSITTFVSFVAYHWICKKRYNKESHWKTDNLRGGYKQIITFNNYNLLSAICLILRDQGSNILINFFFGTIVNAAYAIAKSVQQYVNNLAGNFDVASGPQIVQKLSAGDFNGAERIAQNICRFCCLIAGVGVFTLLSELDFILQIWLGKVPQDTSLFCCLTLILVLVGATSSGLTQIINATGKIKWFSLQFATLYILSLPISYIMYKNGAHPSIVLIVFIIADLLSRCNQLILLKYIAGYHSLKHITGAYIRPLCVFIALVAYILIVRQTGITADNTIFKIANIGITFILSLALSYFIGLKSDERALVQNFIKNKISSNN